MEFNILKKRFDIGRKIDLFLDKVSESGILFKHGVDAYLKGNIDSFKKKLEDITSVEHIGDALRRDLEEQLYTQTLIPERKEVIRFLQIVTNPKRTPVLVHCLHGADRTGAMCALYRIAVQGWTKEAAVKEMTLGGFNFHMVFDNLPQWIQKLDIESISRDAGINTCEKTSKMHGFTAH